MKKFMSTKIKISLVTLAAISLSCYLSAIIVLYNSGYSLSSYFPDWNSNFEWHLGWNDYNSTGIIEKEIPSTIQNINIESVSNNLSVQSYDGSTVKINIDGYFNNDNTYTNGLSKFDISNTDVNIQTNTALKNSDFHVNIYIPKSYKNNILLKNIRGSSTINELESSNLSVTSTSGDIILKNSTFDTVSLESKSGKINSPSITSNHSKIVTTSGDIYIEGMLGDSNVSSASGSIKLNLSNLGTTSNFSSISSDVEITIPKEIGYKVSFSTVTGQLNGKNMNIDLSNNNNISFSNGDGSKNITIKTTSGDLSVK